MNIETIWSLIKISTYVGLTAAIFFWFLAPKKWIVWSEKAAEILPQESPAPWGSLNIYGKSLYILFIGSLVLILVLLFIGFLIEQSYL